MPKIAIFLLAAQNNAQAKYLKFSGNFTAKYRTFLPILKYLSNKCETFFVVYQTTATATFCESYRTMYNSIKKKLNPSLFGLVNGEKIKNILISPTLTISR